MSNLLKSLAWIAGITIGFMYFVFLVKIAVESRQGLEKYFKYKMNVPTQEVVK